jgi:hypothetical protein
MKNLLIISLSLASFTASSATFQGGSSGSFVNPTGESAMVTTGDGTNQFTWGTPAETDDNSSSLGYVGGSFDVNENESFVFGTLNYSNGTIFSATGATAVDLSAELNLTTPSTMTENFTFNLGLINTSNTSDANASADIVNFDNSVPTNLFSYEGTDFTLEFLGFGSLNGGGFTIEDSFRVLEDDNATVDLVGRITSTPGAAIPGATTPSTTTLPPSAVPVPAAVWLFGSGMLGLVGMRKKS